MIPTLDIKLYGWQVNGRDNVVPVWFTENQLPPSLRTVKNKKKQQFLKHVSRMMGIMNLILKVI